MTTQLNKRERRAAQLLAHYATCERLARHLGITDPDGKKISVALWKIERDASNAATAQCNGEAYNGQPFRSTNDHGAISEWDAFLASIQARVEVVLGACPPSFFVNGDPRGYALKIDNETPEGKALIDAVKLLPTSADTASCRPRSPANPTVAALACDRREWASVELPTAQTRNPMTKRKPKPQGPKKRLRPILPRTSVAPETLAAIDGSGLARGRYIDDAVKRHEAAKTVTPQPKKKKQP